MVGMLGMVKAEATFVANSEVKNNINIPDMRLKLKKFLFVFVCSESEFPNGT